VTEPRPRALLDTNVLISALLAQQAGRVTPPLLCLESAARGAYRLVTSPPLIAELTRALAYPKLTIPPDAAYAFVAHVVSLAEPDGLVAITGRLHVLTRDPADNAVLETALVGRAAFLVTGNTKHFADLSGARGQREPRRVQVLSPREFLRTGAAAT
jgi:putative PIN family toxin of toxin-antitoxin system